MKSLETRIREADERYGDYASTHEAAGVALEEWHELLDAIRANDLDAIREEALDMAAVLLRLAYQIDASEAMRARSVPTAQDKLL